MNMRAPIEILIVEDDPTTAFVYRDVFGKLLTPTQVTIVPNGAAALSVLRREGDYVGNSRPQLILLDLHMPGRGGRELLMDVKRDPDFRGIPVIVVSGSGNTAEDVAKVYDLGANAFLLKPEPPETYAQLIHQVEKFWFKHSLLPA